MTPEEKELLINEVIERVMLKMPEIVGNLMTNHAAMIKINKKFYSDYPEFKDHKQVVMSVVEEVDGSDVSQSLESIMRKAVPEIRRRIKMVNSLNMTEVKKPNLNDANGALL